MNIWRTLLWKEAHEQKWKLLALCSIVLSISIAGSIGDKGEGYEIAMGAAINVYALIGPLFVAMNVGSGERSNRSIAFVNALPVATWKAGAARILVGWLVLMISLMAVAVVCQLHAAFGSANASLSLSQLADRLDVSPYLAVLAWIAAASCWSTNLYAWLLLVTVNQKTELRAGLIGLVATVLMLFTTGWTVNHHADFDTSTVGLSFTWILMAGSGILWIMEFAGSQHIESIHLESLLVHVTIISVLLVLATLKYGRQPLFKANWAHRVSVTPATSGRSISPPFTSARSALLWMQYQQSLPIAVCGTTMMLLIVCIQHDSNRTQFLENIGPFFGSILALVIGTGAFVQQLEPELHTFWRSRPISPRQWFWLKYLAGALVLVVCYDVPMFFIEVAVRRGMNISSDVVFSILLHMFVYSLAVLAACGIRHPTYSAILAASGGIAVILLPQVFNQIPEVFCFTGMWRSASSGHPRYMIVQNILNATLLMGPLIASSTLLAEWLIKRDISIPQ